MQVFAILRSLVCSIWRRSSVGRANGSYPLGQGFESLRRYCNLSQEEVASWFSISTQSWSKKEAGKITVFSFADMQPFL
jgi:hypothetical protein